MQIRTAPLLLLTVLLFSPALFSCSEEGNTDITAVVEETAVPEPVESPEPKVEKQQAGVAIVRGDVEPAMPEEYLDAELIFDELEVPELAEGDYAVIGSRIAEFYPNATVDPTDKEPEFEDGIAVPIGTILTLENRIESEGIEWVSPYFKYQSEYNVFWETEWNGETGLVFGADLVSATSASDAAYINHMYTRDRTSEEWRPFNGNRFYSDETLDRLIRDRIVFEPVSVGDYRLTIDLPDDLVSVYANEFSDTENTVFLTSDLMVHSLHLLFDRMLTHMEEEKFIPVLGELLDIYLAELAELEEADDGSHPNYSRGIGMASSYLSVGKALLEMIPAGGPAKDSREYNPHLQYETEDIDRILSGYNELVQLEVQNILSAEGFDFSPIFLYREDYSQYLPRGHYTKSTALSQYFLTMMWFGRIQFYISEAETSYAQSGYFDLGGEETFEEAVSRIYGTDFTVPGNGRELTSHAMPAMYILNEINMKNPEVTALWESLYDPITFIIGQSDDLNFRNISPYMEVQDWPALASWLDSDEKMWITADSILNGNPSPKIAGNSVRYAPAEDTNDETGEEAASSSNFRLFGQRFTFDSYIFTQLSQPRIPLPYDKPVYGIDVMSVFGSRSAEKLFYDQNPDYEVLRPTVEGLADTFESQDPDVLPPTFYNRYLSLVKDMARFEQGEGFYFTETPAWNIKSLISSHASWAELRHDTILYVKQSYAERAGGGDMDASYRTEPYPRPIHYVEPDIDFFYSLKDLMDNGIAELADSGNLPATYASKFGIYSDIVDNLVTVVENEVLNEPITDSMNNYIASVPNKLAKIILPPDVDSASFSDDPDQMKMALIADVHTDTVIGVLEVATGIPYRIHVALNDGDGGRRIATGYTFSYYEFYNPGLERKTDEQWKEIVYGNSDLQQYLPFWLADSDFLLP